MKLRVLFVPVLIALSAGNALAGRACPSDVATGAGTACDKSTHPAHASASTHLPDASIAVPAALPAHNPTNAGCCSMPFSSAGDVVSASGAAAASHNATADAATTPHASKSAPAKPVSRQPQRSAVAPAFGPLFLAHQALML